MNGLTLWLRADTLPNLVDGEPVAVWIDQSGNGLDMPQNDPARQPIFVENVINGRPVLRFDGNDFFRRESVNGFQLTSFDQTTVYFVIRQVGADPNNTLLAWGSGNNRFLLHTTVPEELQLQHGNPNGGGKVVWPQPADWDDNFHVVEFFRNGAVAEGSFDASRRTPFAQFSTFTDTPELVESHPLFIGNDIFGNTFTGDVAEILVYNRALTDLERIQVETFLMLKYQPIPAFIVGGPPVSVMLPGTGGPNAIGTAFIVNPMLGVMAPGQGSAAPTFVGNPKPSVTLIGLTPGTAFVVIPPISLLLPGSGGPNSIGTTFIANPPLGVMASGPGAPNAPTFIANPPVTAEIEPPP